jgi:hypothetical protein
MSQDMDVRLDSAAARAGALSPRSRRPGSIALPNGGFDVTIGADIALPAGAVSDFDMVTRGAIRAVVLEATATTDPNRIEPMRGLRIYGYTVGLVAQVAAAHHVSGYETHAKGCSAALTAAVHHMLPRLPRSGVESRVMNLQQWRAYLAVVERELAATGTPSAMIHELVPDAICRRLVVARDGLIEYVLTTLRAEVLSGGRNA